MRSSINDGESIEIELNWFLWLPGESGPRVEDEHAAERELDVSTSTDRTAGCKRCDEVIIRYVFAPSAARALILGDTNQHPTLIRDTFCFREWEASRLTAYHAVLAEMSQATVDCRIFYMRNVLH